MQKLWAIAPPATPYASRTSASRTGAEAAAKLERVVPTGAMHVVVRLSPEPLVLFSDEHGEHDERGKGARVVGHSLVGGARSKFYLRSIDTPSWSVGAQLTCGAGPLLFGCSSGELAEAHTPLDDLWAHDAVLLRERLSEEPSLERQIDRLEEVLLSKLRGARHVDPVVADAVVRFTDQARVADVVAKSGYSHRAFLTRFRDAVGLSPKTFCRIARVQKTLENLNEGSSFAHVAALAGYADQAHGAREFKEITGVTLSRYRELCPIASNHVPVPPTR